MKKNNKKEIFSLKKAITFFSVCVEIYYIIKEASWDYIMARLLNLPNS